MSDTPSRFPLAWPAHRPRTKAPKSGPFRYKAGRGWMEPVTTAMSLERLEAELSRLGAQLPILSSNIELRLDGKPRSGTNPADPGVALYFQLKGTPHTMACDTYDQVAQNIAALAAHIESTRAIARYGVATAAEILQAFAALPPPAAQPTGRPWREVFGLEKDFGTMAGGLMPEEAKMVLANRYRDMAKKIGAGGDQEALKELNVAKAAGEKEIMS